MKSKKVVICSNYAWTVFNFRMPLIRRLRREGYIVEVITQFDGYEERIATEVDKIHNLFISRKGMNPFVDLVTFCDLFLKFRALKPDVALLFTIKPVIYGMFACRVLRITGVPTLTGLGTIFIRESLATRLVERMYQLAFDACSLVFFQNSDDSRLFIERKLVRQESCRLSPGSGVDLVAFPAKVLTNKPEITFLLIARMLWDKGVKEFIEAATIVKKRHPHVRFQLLGPLGVENRTAIPADQVARWQDDGVIEYLGETDDVARVIEKACCVVLPSYREGTSRVLLESAAMCRPLIASDVPGCREVVDDGVNGFLCKPKDVFSLTEKMESMINLPFCDRVSMGQKGRQKIKSEFSEDIVCTLYLDAMKSIMIQAAV